MPLLFQNGHGVTIAIDGSDVEVPDTRRNTEHLAAILYIGVDQSAQILINALALQPQTMQILNRGYRRAHRSPDPGRRPSLFDPDVLDTALIADAHCVKILGL